MVLKRPKEVVCSTIRHTEHHNLVVHGLDHWSANWMVQQEGLSQRRLWDDPCLNVCDGSKSTWSSLGVVGPNTQS